MKKLINITGKTFGRLTVLQREGTYTSKGGHHCPTWKCICSCGKEIIVLSSNIRQGKTTSCGCFRIEATSKAMTTHGYFKTDRKLASLVHNAMRRCCEPNCKEYRYYGYRGVKFNFNSVPEAIEYIKNNLPPRQTGETLDRTNNMGHYEPGNITWAQRSQQNKNKRKRLQFFKDDIQQFCSAAGITEECFESAYKALNYVSRT